MTLLSIFHTGGVTLALTLVFLFLEFIFGRMMWQEFKARKAEGTSKPFYQLMAFKFCAGILVMYIFAMWQVASDYTGI